MFWKLELMIHELFQGTEKVTLVKYETQLFWWGIRRNVKKVGLSSHPIRR